MKQKIIFSIFIILGILAFIAGIIGFVLATQTFNHSNTATVNPAFYILLGTFMVPTLLIGSGLIYKKRHEEKRD